MASSSPLDQQHMDMMTMLMQIENLSHQSYDHHHSSSSNTTTPNYPNHQVYLGTPVQEPIINQRNINNNNSSMGAMREMIFRIAAMQPIHIDPESVKAPKRRNVKISKDPQSVAARHRREKISERIRILQRLVPGGTKMDTASMLDEAVHYVKFLKKQLHSLEQANGTTANGNGPAPAYATFSSGSSNNHMMLR